MTTSTCPAADPIASPVTVARRLPVPPVAACRRRAARRRFTAQDRGDGAFAADATALGHRIDTDVPFGRPPAVAPETAGRRIGLAPAGRVVGDDAARGTGPPPYRPTVTGDRRPPGDNRDDGT